ncbi:MAG: hypothetical protein WCX28_12130 [Bacteriovoracaceae bacterium]|nr:hypothetical protein [Bacteroidota bacterium]
MKNSIRTSKWIQNNVRFHCNWSGLDAIIGEQIACSGEWVVMMKRSPYGCCDIVRASIF